MMLSVCTMCNACNFLSSGITHPFKQQAQGPRGARGVQLLPREGRRCRRRNPSRRCPRRGARGCWCRRRCHPSSHRRRRIVAAALWPEQLPASPVSQDVRQGENDCSEKTRQVCWRSRRKMKRGSPNMHTGDHVGTVRARPGVCAPF